MGHNLQALGTAALDTMGGLVTFASARDLPEGASPRNWDVDYSVGSVTTRAGLVSAYSFATVLEITGYFLDAYTGLATFTYVGPEPTLNEGFLLSGFTGIYSVLNGQTVYVESVSMTQFSGFVVDGPTTSGTGLDGVATSTTGQFVGPNVGSNATSTTWLNPGNISSATLYTSAQSGTNESAGPASPTTVTQTGEGSAWSNPSNLVASGSSFATVTVSASTLSSNLLANGTGFDVPAGATITGISVSFNGQWSGDAAGTIVNLQLATNGFAVGTPLNFAISSSNASYTKGSSSYTWGTTFTPTTVNGSQLGVLVNVGATGNSGANTASLNGLQVTVYYTLGLVSEVLTVQGFGFAISETSGVTGFGLSFNAYSSTNTTVSLQLLLSGVPVGTPKLVDLTTTPTVYNLGGGTDAWGYVWSASNVNSPQFGVQLTAMGSGTTYANDLDIITYVSSALENFNWVGSFEQENDALSTLALDAAGNMWIEDVINNPGVLSLSLTGIIPGSFANGATIDDSEFVMFSDLSIGTDRPRQLYNNGSWYPVTQVGPGVAPSFKASTGSISGILTLTSYTYSAGVAVFTFDATAAAPTVDSLYVLNVPGTFLDKQVVTVLSAPPPTTTMFAANVSNGTGSGATIVGTATPQFEYSITSITQTPSAFTRGVLERPALVLWSAGATSTAAGSVITIFYNSGHDGYSPDQLLTNIYNAGYGCYVEITGTSGTSVPVDGVWQVIAVGTGVVPPGEDTEHNYFSVAYNTSGQTRYNNPNIDYQITQATLMVSPAILGLTPGTNITITGVTGTPQSGWNNTWSIVEAVNSGQYTITATQYTTSPSGLATYSYQFASTTNSQVPIVGQLIEVTGCTNNAAFNGTFVINSVNAADNTFTVVMTIPGLDNEPTPIPEGSAQAVMSGTEFLIDPGINFVQTAADVIYGNVTDQGNFFVIGSTALVPIGAGTRQAVCFFITDTGAWTPASPPVTFTTNTDANLLNVSGIPIGPSNVVARGIAITEAGANGVPGANFYVITQPVTNTVGTVVTTYSSTIINDNTSTTAAFSFTDAVLLNSQEVDIPGFNIFNQIELGSSAWCVPYSSRMFYGMQLNKVFNFNNLTFDGGYVVPNQPAGWGLYLTANELQLVDSPVTLSAYYVSNTTGSIQPVMGMISQTAYQDSYNVDIIAPNTAYSVRVAAACPSGVRLGILHIDLTSLSGGNFGTTYGSFTVPLADMGTLPTVFSGSILPVGIFIGSVPITLQLRVWVENMGIGADVLIDRIEVYPTSFPFLKTEVYGSYINKPEAIDASGDGGIIDTSTENPQTCFGGFVLRDNLYLLKTSSMYFTKDNPNSEPGGWSLNEVSNRVGAVGINAYDTGEEWAVMACRAGLYGFSGSDPKPLNLETLDIWNAINWNAGNTICVRNDINNRRIFCAVPLPTGTSPEGVATATVQWLPYAPYNPAPTTPNVILMLNYQALSSFEELMASISVHATMFGTLAAPDMRRKWTIWNIATPYMGFILRSDYIDAPLYICNGIGNSKIYDLDPNQRSDDGVSIFSLYTTYGHVNAAKSVTMPIFGMHAKRYTALQVNIQGAGTANVRLIPNDLGARYPYTVPGGMALTNPANDDLFKSVNVKGQRVFLEFSTNAVGSWFDLCKTLLTGKQDAWSSLNPTGGGNIGIV